VASLVLPPAPNPTSGRTRFAWSADIVGAVSVRVFAISGRLVWERASLDGAAGGVEWDGRDLSGHRVANGVYLVELRGDGEALGTERVVVRR
jgi:hypothetical protein